jgi:hypothetical protein
MSTNYNPFAQLGQAIGIHIGNGGGGGGQLNAANIENAVVSTQQALAYQQALQAQAINEKPFSAFDPNNPAWDASISTISDLWLAKFGNEWVSEDVLNHDNFFSIIATRLYKLNRLEKHNVPNTFHPVYRIVE